MDNSAISCVSLDVDAFSNFTDTSEGEILTLNAISIASCYPAPNSTATIIQANSSGGCTPQGTWIPKAHSHIAQVPERKLGREDECHYPILKEAEGNGLAVGLGSPWSSFPISFFYILSRKLQKEPTAFLMLGPSFISPYFPRRVLFNHCYHQRRCYLFTP